ncbi:hypothetical protein E3D45_42860, partial [Burkholderia cepacia]
MITGFDPVCTPPFEAGPPRALGRTETTQAPGGACFVARPPPAPRRRPTDVPPAAHPSGGDG